MESFASSKSKMQSIIARRRKSIVVNDSDSDANSSLKSQTSESLEGDPRTSFFKDFKLLEKHIRGR